jgi:hypothetical protein
MISCNKLYETGGVAVEGIIALLLLVILIAGSFDIYSFGQTHLDLTYAAKQAAQVAFAYQRTPNLPNSSQFGSSPGYIPTQDEVRNCVETKAGSPPPPHCGSIVVRHRVRSILQQAHARIHPESLRITEEINGSEVKVFIKARYNSHSVLFKNHMFNVQEKVR